jgi:hypothetical protein
MKTQTIAKIIMLPLLALLGACASDQVQPENPAVTQKLESIDRTQKAVLVIYRNDDSNGRGVHPTVTMNGKDLVDTGNGEVFVTGIDPGHYVLEMDDKKSGTDVTVKAGDDVYIRVDIVQGVWRPGGRITQVTPQQGRYEAARMDLTSPNHINMPEYR